MPEDRVADETVRRLLAGVVATERALLDALAKHGIHRIASLGERFDPDRHEAVFEVTAPDRPPGTVAEVLQEGYLHHDRLLRPAMVGVAKGGEEATEQRTPQTTPIAAAGSRCRAIAGTEERPHGPPWARFFCGATCDWIWKT
jgi:hypothetical protein